MRYARAEAAADDNNDTIFTATYDARTRRLTKTEGASTKMFRYDGGTNFQELTPGTPADNANPAMLGDVTAELIRAGGLGGGIGSVLYNDDTASSDPDSVEFFVYNAVGHTVALSDYSSAVTQSTVYEAFGQDVAQSGTSTNNRLRNTKERDASLGLDNDGFRYYDPATGRYISRDPIGYGDGLNVFESVGSDPINTVDPLGLAAGDEYFSAASEYDWHGNRGTRQSLRIEKVRGTTAGAAAATAGAGADAVAGFNDEFIPAGQQIRESLGKDFKADTTSISYTGGGWAGFVADRLTGGKGKAGSEVVEKVVAQTTKRYGDDAVQAIAKNADDAAAKIAKNTDNAAGGAKAMAGQADDVAANAAKDGSVRLTDDAVKWKNGYRTSDGKYGSPTGTRRSGADAESDVWDSIEREKGPDGWTVTRGRVHVRDGDGVERVYDGYATSPSGRNIGLEVKSNTARRDTGQRAFDGTLNSSRGNKAYGTGKHEGVVVDRSVEIRRQTSD